MRRAVIVCIVALLMASTEIAAHAIVTATSLKEHPVEPGEPTHVLLTFNSALEIALSRIFLVSAGDHSERLTLEPGSKPGEFVVELPALAVGDYALKYRVVAVDGHVTEDVIRFHVGQ